MSAETWLAEVKKIVRQYRIEITAQGANTDAARERALAQLQKLGLSTGEAMRYLKPGPKED